MNENRANVSETPPGTSAQSGTLRRWWLAPCKLPLATATLVALLDQLTKHVIASQWLPGTHRVVIPSFFHLVHIRNTGAAWGLFRGQTVLLAVLSVAVFSFIWFRFSQLVAGHIDRAIGLALIMGGILGNLVDRVFRGEVVDFLLFFYGSFHWPAFNVADTAICVGVGLFILSSFFHPQHAAS